jgi:hypothetical protein
MTGQELEKGGVEKGIGRNYEKALKSNYRRK